MNNNYLLLEFFNLHELNPQMVVATNYRYKVIKIYNCTRYHLVGYKTTTCTSDYQWSNLTPECVLVTSAADQSERALGSVIGGIIMFFMVDLKL